MDLKLKRIEEKNLMELRELKGEMKEILRGELKGVSC